MYSMYSISTDNGERGGGKGSFGEEQRRGREWNSSDFSAAAVNLYALYAIK